MIELPRANWPKKEGKYKVIQFYIEGEPYLRFNNPVVHTYEGIISRTASKLGKKYPRKKIGPYNLAALESEWYKIPGMGTVRIYFKGMPYGRNTAILEDQDTDYRDYIKGIDPEHIERVKPFCPQWDFEILKSLNALP